MPDFPTTRTTVTCGVCAAELDFDGEQFHCATCQLTYPDADSPGQYTDPEEEPCGVPYPYQLVLTNTHPFKRTRHPDGTTTVEQWRTTIREYGTCRLPVSHVAGMHDWAATIRFEYHDHDPGKG